MIIKKTVQLDLNNYVKTNILKGDWALHNLIYCNDRKKIFNIDLEGFYTYPHIYDNGNCNIKHCNENVYCLQKKRHSGRISILN